MEYLKYDEIFKKRCPECHGSDHAKKRFRKLFGKSFPENGGVVMNNFKYMKQKMNTDYKFDDRELALIVLGLNPKPLQDASSDDDYEYEDDNDELGLVPLFTCNFDDDDDNEEEEEEEEEEDDDDDDDDDDAENDDELRVVTSSTGL